jgi:phosphoglycerate dehydrogenase-like enzyme|tara:strand:- start:117 stop:1070 length:954 start_codon:yes stop_codon:yes gene_type:complete
LTELPDGPLRQSDIAIRLNTAKADALEPVLKERFPEIEVTRAPLKTARKLRILVTFHTPDDEDLSGYQWVHSIGAGVDAICKRLEGAANVPLVTRTTGRMGEQIGEYCAAYTLAHLQKMAVRRALQVSEDWDRERAAPAYLFETRIGVIGTGSIGSGVTRALSALGGKVTGFSRSGRPSGGFETVKRLDELQAGDRLDVLVAALPFTEETDGALNTEVFAALQGGLFINVGRGATLDEAALRRALEAGQVSHAVLDVFRDEPLEKGHWLWKHDQVTITPHVSGLTLDEDGAYRLAELLDGVLAGDWPAPDVDVRRGY